MLFAQYLKPLFSNHFVTELTVVADERVLDAAIDIPPSAKVWTSGKQRHTVLLAIKIVGLWNIPVSKFCLSSAIEAAVVQGPTPAVYQVVMKTYPSFACSKTIWNSALIKNETHLQVWLQMA